MKKYFMLVLLVVPFTSFAAPSVRMLGGKASTTTDGGAKVTPAKVSSSATGAISARVGTARSAKVKPASVSATSVSTNSRFPSITPSHIYTSVVPTSKVGSGTQVAAVNTDEVVNTVMDNVYSKDEFDEAVKNAVEKEVYKDGNFDTAVKESVENNVYNSQEFKTVVEKEVYAPEKLQDNIYTTNEFRSAVTKNQVFGGVKLGAPTDEEKKNLPENYVQIWIETAN